MEAYLSQIYRSKSLVKVTRSKIVHWDVPMTSESLVFEQKRNPGIQLIGIGHGVFSKHMRFHKIYNCPMFKDFPQVIFAPNQHDGGSKYLSDVQNTRGICFYP